MSPRSSVMTGKPVFVTWSYSLLVLLCMVMAVVVSLRRLAWRPAVPSDLGPSQVALDDSSWHQAPLSNEDYSLPISQQQQQQPKQKQLQQPPNPAHKNVMLIIADDLRWAPIFPSGPLASLQGGLYKHAPNIQKLQRSGVVFDRAFANVPWCGPSRASFLTGREPTETKAYSVEGNFRINPKTGSWRTLPQFFLDRGYKTYGAGKVFHRGSADDQNPNDWSEILAYNVAQGKGYTLGNCIPKVVRTRHVNVSWCHFYQDGVMIPTEIGKMLMCRTKDPLELLDDFVVAQASVKKLHEIAREPHSFFMAVGFYRPHMPYHLHKTFWDMHEKDLSRVPDPEFNEGPEPRADMPPEFAVIPDGIETGAQVNAFPMVYEGLADWRLRRAMRVGYAAAISQMDTALGQVLDALEETQLASNTAVIFYGDHGFHLGESSLWYKKLLTDFATHVPLVMRVPWIPKQEENRHVTDTFVELLDVYKTLADITGFTEHLAKDIQGKSLMPLLLGDSDMKLDANNNHAISLISRCRSRQCRGMGIENLGFSIRTEAWRYNVWVAVNTKTLLPDWSSLNGEELYRHDVKNMSYSEEHFNVQKEKDLERVKLELLKKIQDRYRG